MPRRIITMKEARKIALESLRKRKGEKRQAVLAEASGSEASVDAHNSLIELSRTLY